MAAPVHVADHVPAITESTMRSPRKLGFRAAPPMPEQVVAQDGSVVYTRADIEQGRQVWQSTGGMQLGSIWGHGAYVAPDWSADWLHRESVGVLDLWARRDGGMATYADLRDQAA